MEPPPHPGDGAGHDDDGASASASASAPGPQNRPQQRPSPPAPPPPPSLISIDDLLDAAASALPFGGLLHGPLFSLHDAMLAVEVGDPKLDAGAARAGEEASEEDRGGAMQSASSSTSTTTSTSTPAASSCGLSATDAVAALDGLVAAEAAWLAGGCLETTILTCLFMLRPQSQIVATAGAPVSRTVGGTDDGDDNGGGDGDLDLGLVVRAAASATRAAVAAARSLVTRAGVCEDEDFQLFQQALPSPPPSPAKGESESGRGGGSTDDGEQREQEAEELLSEAEEKLSSSSSSSSSVASALALRLRFRRATLRALRAAERAAATERSSASLAAAVADALGALGALEGEEGAAEAIPSSSSAASPSPSPSPSSQFPLDALRGFDSAAARRELPPSPPRPDRALGVSAGRAYWRKLLSDLSAVASFPESVAREEGGEEEEGVDGRRHRHGQSRWHLRGALRAVRAFAGRGAGAVPRSALALVLGLALDAAAAGGENGSGKSSESNSDGKDANGTPAQLDGDDGDDDGDDSDSRGDNPYISESSVRDALRLPQDPSAAPFSISAGGEGGGGEGPDQPNSSNPPTISMAAKFVEQAVLGLQGWAVAALLNPCRSRRRHRRCLEDWVHVHQHAVNAENDEAFARWLEGGDGWDWRLPASSSSSPAAAAGAGDDDGGDSAAAAAPPPVPPPPMSPADAAIVDHASPLSCWVEEQACRAQRDHLLQGFALDLYAPHEAAAVLLVAEHLERRAEGAAGALAERFPPSPWCPREEKEQQGGGEKEEGEKGKKRAGSAKGGKKPPPAAPRAAPPPPPLPHRNGLAAAADSRAATARRYVAGALLRAAAALMAESVVVNASAAAPLSSKGGGSSPSLSARVPPAPEPFNSARDRFAARFQSGPLARLSTPPQLSHWDFERAVGDPLRAIAENNRERFSEGGGGGGASGGGSAGPGRGRAGGLLSCLRLLGLAKDACLLARRALPQLAGAETAALGPRALSEEEEGALSRVLGMTAVSLGVLEKEELEAEEKLLLRAKKGRNNEGAATPNPPSAPAPSPLLVSWDCSIHALYPALRVKRK